MRQTQIISVLSLIYWGGTAEDALPHVERYEVVTPQRLSARSRRSASTQANDDRERLYPDELLYDLHIGGKKHTISLEKNRLLIGENYTETYYQKIESTVTPITTSPDYGNHCYYRGHIPGMEDSSVSVGLCAGMKGFIRAGEQVYFIEPLGGTTEGQHALYKQEHLRTRRSWLGDTIHTTSVNEPRPAGLLSPDDGKSETAFKTQRFVEMFLVVDNTEYEILKRLGEDVKTRMLGVVNHVDMLYRPLNIRVLLVGMEVWNVRDEIKVSRNADDTLSSFTEWRQNKLLRRIKHDNTQLVTGVDFEGDTVGLASRSAMCTESSAAINQDHNLNPHGLASTIAHEMGHNMGMSHDASHCSCVSSSFSQNCIMTERVGTSAFPDRFSDCSLQQISVFLDNVNPGCLLEPPSSDRLYSGPVCGNALLDTGEECDCGSVAECENPCCNATTCRLTAGSKCAEGACCENCQIKGAASLCRAAVNDCDLEEYCTGLSNHCPNDDFQMNGKSCRSGQGHCYNGQCPSLLQHCQRLWGPGAQVAADACFFRNTFGFNDSHCGKSGVVPKPCAKSDIHCGTIFCIGGNQYPVTGQKAIISTPRAICNIAGEHSGAEGLSMVPTGTTCGPNKVCYNNMCQDVSVYGSDEDCAVKCNGRGVCNHHRECHCEPGWTPPYCDVKRADVSHDTQTVIVGVSVAVAVLLILVIGGVVYFKKGKDIFRQCKRKGRSQGGRSRAQYKSGDAMCSYRGPPPQIGEPMLLESSTNQACTPLMARAVPCRPPPQPPVGPPDSGTAKIKPPPPPPPKPVNVRQASSPAVPAVPPGKPVLPNGCWETQITDKDGKLALRPPTLSRR